MRTRTAPLDAIALLRKFVDFLGEDTPDLYNALDDLDAFVHDMTDEAPDEGVNIEELHKLLEGGFPAYQGTLSNWDPRADWGGYRLDGWGRLATALDWECHSCRPDVGWSKWDTAIREFDTGKITIHVECGHCGDTSYFDKDGNEVPEEDA